MIKDVHKKIILPILLLGMIFASVFLLCGCSLDDFKGDDSDSGGNSNVGYVSDIYYDGNFFCYEIKDCVKYTYLKTSITIDGVETELKDKLLQSFTDDVHVSTFNVYDEVNTCTASTFTLNAYMQDSEGKNKSETKSVTFDNIIFQPKLNTLTGDITWDINDKVEASYIMARVDWTNRVEVYPLNNTGRFNANQIFDAFNTNNVKLEMTAKHPDDLPERNTFYLRRKTVLNLGKQTLMSVHYNNGKIYWYNSDNSIFDTQLPETYNLTIVDGDDTIYKTVRVPYGQDKREFDYFPRHNNFSVTLSGGVEHDYLIEAKPVKVTPKCVGTIKNFNINSTFRELRWAVELIGDSNLDVNTFEYDFAQDGEYINTTSNRAIPLSNFANVYGNSTIDIMPKFDAVDSYICVTPISIYVGKTARIGFGDKTENGIKLKFLDIDSNASRYKLYSSQSSYCEIIENVYEGMEFNYIPVREKDYIYLEPIYEGVDYVINLTNSAKIEFLKETQLVDVTRESDGLWYANFDESLYEKQKVEYFIVTDAGETRYETTSNNMSIMLPKELAESSDSKEVTLRIRYYPENSSSYNFQVTNVVEEFVFKNLPMPTNSWVENNKLEWDFSTNLTYDGFNVEIYKGTPTGSKSLVSSKKVTEQELDLSNVSTLGGDYFTYIYANAVKGNTNEIILNGSKCYIETFYKFSEAGVYPVNQDKLKIEVNSAQSAKGDGVVNFSVKLYADELEENVTINVGEQLDIRQYLDKWNIDTIKADVVVNADVGYVKSCVKTVTIKAPDLCGFALSNEFGTISFDKYLTSSTYDYSLKVKDSKSNDYKEILSDTGISDSDIEVLDAILSVVNDTKNVDKYYGDLELSVTTHYNSLDLFKLRNDNVVTMPPRVTSFAFSGLTYGVTQKDTTSFKFEFNKELTVDPKINVKTTNGKSLGNVLASNGKYNFTSLSQGKYTLVFTNDIASSILDELNTFNLPYYHSFNVRGKETPDGTFKNFVKGRYYYQKDYLGKYVIDEAASIPATVDFYPTCGSKFVFMGEEVSLTGGKYTLNLLKSNSISVSISANEGLLGAHNYNMYTYTNNATLSFKTNLPPVVESLNTKNGILNISVAYYFEDVYYIVERSGVTNPPKRYFTKDVNSGKDTFDPSDGTYYPKFSSGEEIVIVICGGYDGNVIEADSVIEYTVP